jgi:PadR family transcriptional regulator, regulatory protein PadR
MEMQSDLIRGNLDTILLGFLKKKDRYGYEICKLAKEKSEGEYELKEPSMYSTIRRLEAQGCIEGYWGDETQGGRRKYYRITPKGISMFKENIANWEFAKRVIDRLLEESR